MSAQALGFAGKIFWGALEQNARDTFDQCNAAFALLAPEQHAQAKELVDSVNPSAVGIATSVATAGIAVHVWHKECPKTALAMVAVSATSAYVTHRTYTSEEHKLKLACELLEKKMEAMKTACSAAKEQKASLESAAEITKKEISSLSDEISKFTSQCFDLATRHRPVFNQLLDELNILETKISGEEEQFDILDQVDVVKKLVREQLNAIGA